MMNREQIEQTVRDNFKFVGSVQLTVDTHGVVNVEGSLQLRNKKLQQIPVQFGTVTGSFEITSSAIHSLQGCPRVVLGTFSCDGCNNLTSLEGGPQTVHGYYDCQFSSLTSLKGCATRVDRMLDVRHNPLTSLEGLTPGVTQIRLNWDPQLPLLRVLELPEGFQIPAPGQQSWDRTSQPWEKILEPYMGQGRAGAINAAIDLIREGKKIQKQQDLSENPFKKNARW